MQVLPASAARPRQGSAFIWLVCGIAALGGLLFGWDWVVIGGAKPFFERYFEIQNDAGLSGWANSCALIGCLIGALGAGSLGDRYGRKPLLAAAAILFALTALPARLFVTGVSILPESPRWFVKRGRIEEARRTLERIGGSDHARAEITAIAATPATQKRSSARPATTSRGFFPTSCGPERSTWHLRSSP